MIYEIGVPPGVNALCSLRESVGWDRADADYPPAFDAYATCVTACTTGGELVGWCAALSDGVRHGFLLDLIVSPTWQRRGIGRGLVERAIRGLKQRGVSVVHADFAPAHAEFYRRCGFEPSSAGIRTVVGE
ncbi:MAG: GNAT family N-acetyltransferase [Gammaproteobacteria bacterium]